MELLIIFALIKTLALQNVCASNISVAVSATEMLISTTVKYTPAAIAIHLRDDLFFRQ
jgi:hypothetical protein